MSISILSLIRSNSCVVQQEECTLPPNDRILRNKIAFNQQVPMSVPSFRCLLSNLWHRTVSYMKAASCTSCDRRQRRRRMAALPPRSDLSQVSRPYAQSCITMTSVSRDPRNSTLTSSTATFAWLDTSCNRGMRVQVSVCVGRLDRLDATESTWLALQWMNEPACHVIPRYVEKAEGYQYISDRVVFGPSVFGGGGETKLFFVCKHNLFVLLMWMCWMEFPRL